MKNRKYLVSLLVFNLYAQGYAGVLPLSYANTVVTLSGGPIWPTDMNKQQSIYFSPELSRTYTVNNYTHVLGEGEIFLGRQHTLNQSVDGQLGIVYGGSSQLKVSGSIWDFNDPRFNNYRYGYKIQLNRVALAGKLIANTDSWLKPWVSSSIGIGINHAGHYRVMPLECETVALAAANFSGHTKTAFSYTVGAGLQRILTQHWQLGAGYEFTDWGKNQLNPAPAQLSQAQGLTRHHLLTNGLLFNITWIA